MNHHHRPHAQHRPRRNRPRHAALAKGVVTSDLPVCPSPCVCTIKEATETHLSFYKAAEHGDQGLSGWMDRITGDVSVTYGEATYKLTCKPTKPLF
jgi:hypothetical protein